MIIIAFSHNTSKLLPRLLCRKFRHCAPIFQFCNKLVMYQFVRPGKTKPIYLTARDIRILRKHEWQFIYVPIDAPYEFHPKRAYSCVDLSKRAIGVHARTIQTPYALYRYLAQK